MKPSRNILVVDLLQDSLYDEVVSYAYDLGGQLRRVYSSQLIVNSYLDSVKYDRFGAKTSQKYGNGLKTSYTYNNLTRRLSNIATMNGNSQSLTENFTYDASDQLVSLLFLCSPKEKKQKENALAAVEKNPVHYAHQLAERRNRRCGRMQSQACLGYAEPRGEKDAKHLNSQHRSTPLPCYGKRIFSVTPQDGEITTEYAPLWQNGTLPKYSFNAKELDEETGMYYYEARYYKPPVFTSRDPMFEKYFWMTPYAYCANNPVKYVDPNGKWPTKKVSGDKVSRNFSNTKKTHPISKEKRNHYGVDFAVPTNTEVHAAASGIVIYTGYQYNKQSKTGYGYYIDIQHDNGYITRYAHLSTIEVKKDDEVTDGFIIGYSGATGGVTGPHLHFEIMKDGEYIDPLTVNDLQKRINFENGCPIQLDEVKVIDIAPVFEFSDPLINMNEKYIEDALKRMIEDIKPIDIYLNNLQNDEYTKVKK